MVMPMGIPMGHIPIWKVTAFHSCLYIKFFLLENYFYLFLIQNDFLNALKVKKNFYYFL